MSKANVLNLGGKRVCPSCSARFYDLGKNPAKCPKCGKMHDSTIPVTRRRRKATVEVAADDPLLKAKAKAEVKQKPKKPVKEIEGVNLDAFDDIEPLGADEEIEELDDDIDDIESLEELEDVEENNKTEDSDENAIEEEVVSGTLGEDLEDGEDDDEDEEDGKSRSKSKDKAKGKGKSKPAGKPKPKAKAQSRPKLVSKKILPKKPAVKKPVAKKPVAKMAKKKARR